jgi:putative transposase
MGDVGACWDNAAVELFFGILKYNRILKVNHPTRLPINKDDSAYMRYCNFDRLHSAHDDISPTAFELSELTVSAIS